jgi:hypothetical protein
MATADTTPCLGASLHTAGVAQTLLPSLESGSRRVARHPLDRGSALSRLEGSKQPPERGENSDARDGVTAYIDPVVAR